MSTYDQLQPLKETIRQRMEGTPFFPFIAPKKESDLKMFLAKAEGYAKFNDSKDDVLSNPESVRNILDQVPDSDLELYIKSYDSQETAFLGTWQEYVKKFDFDLATFNE